MKKHSVLIITIFLIGFPVLASVTIGNNVTHSLPEKIKVQVLISNYVAAFDGKNISVLKAVATDHFILATGGKKVWTERFAKNSKKSQTSKTATVKNLIIVSRKDLLYVRFDAGDKMPGGQWFILKKKNRNWLIDDLINDFNAEGV